MSAIETRELFRIHATPDGEAAALQGLTLTVAEREVVVILGPSGSGKTSLLRILAGLDRASSGSARVFGQELTRLSHLRLARYRQAMLGYADQHFAQTLAPELSAREFVMLPLRLRGIARSEARSRAELLLESVGLGERRDARPNELSGGEQQRVALAAALAPRPRLLLADEPTGELDGAHARIVYELIGELARAEGCTTVLVSHDEASKTIADRVVEIRDGRLAAESLDGTGATDAIVVGRGGWLRLPKQQLAQARIGSRALVRAEEGRIVLVPAESAEREPGPPPTAPTGAPAEARVVASVRDLAKHYDGGPGARIVFEHLDATFDAGKLYALTGPSGSGKSTFLRLLAGLTLPTAGEVSIAGRTISSLPRAERARVRAAEIGVVAQDAGLIPFLGAAENVELALGLRGLPREAAAKRAQQVLVAVGLGERSTVRVALLSSGERARAALARALGARPTVLLIDEPTSRLDEANARSVATLLARLAPEWGTAIVCATHDPRVIEQADEVVPLGR